MLILIMMLLIGLFAGVWGLLMCFFPTRWDKLTEANELCWSLDRA